MMKLPAGSHGVVARVFQRIAMRGQRGDDDIIVRVLREAEALAGQLRGELEERELTLASDPQVDLRVDEPNVPGDPQRHPRERVHRGAPVGRQPPERDRLAVVTLLNAGIEIGVAIERDEELGQQLLGCRNVEPSGLEV